MSKDEPPSRRSKPVQPADRSSGRVSFDPRGNAIWEWSVATGRFTTTVSTARLKALEHPGLSLVDDDAGPVPAAGVSAKLPTTPRPARGTVPAAASGPRRAGMGYSPYDSGIPPSRPMSKATGAAAARKTDLRRLGEFFKLRKQVERNKNGKE